MLLGVLSRPSVFSKLVMLSGRGVYEQNYRAIHDPSRRTETLKAEPKQLVVVMGSWRRQRCQTDGAGVAAFASCLPIQLD